MSTATDPMAAAGVGVIVRAIPTPPTIRPGKRSHHVPFSPSREKIRSDPATRVIPIPTSQREPTLSEYFPASGAIRMIRIVIGRKLAPAFVGEYWRMSCRYNET